MPKFSKKRGKKAGLPSETLVYTGERKDEKITIHVIDYDEHRAEEKEISSIEECIPYKTKPTITWINVDGVHNAAMLEKLGECFNLHRLVLEDIMNTDQRPKTEDYGDYLYLVLKMLSNGRVSRPQASAPMPTPTNPAMTPSRTRRAPPSSGAPRAGR